MQKWNAREAFFGLMDEWANLRFGASPATGTTTRPTRNIGRRSRTRTLRASANGNGHGSNRELVAGWLRDTKSPATIAAIRAGTGLPLTAIRNAVQELYAGKVLTRPARGVYQIQAH